MAEMTTENTQSSACCAPAAQVGCCEPAAKQECCGATQQAGGCGCEAGETVPAGADIRETVRERYAAAARAVAEQQAGSCCGPIPLTDSDEARVFGSSLYDGAETEGATASAIAASLGCGVPTAVAELRQGETVLDLGSGAGADVLISARRVGPTGKAIGLDMTDEMLELARANAAQAGVENVEFVKGYIEEIPLADASVDAIVSNCVVNLSGDKPRVFAEASRVLRPGGRFAVSDVIASPSMDEATRADLAAYTGCIAGALTEREFRDGLAAAGFTDIEIRETHRVHEHATSAIIRASKPAAASATSEQPAAQAPLAAAGRRLELFEPAMCCQAGVCGPSVDQQLIDVREDLRWASSQGAEVVRHNLSSDPDAFVANSRITGLLAAFGEGALPALVIDGNIAVHGRYATREELTRLLVTEPQPVAVPAAVPIADDGRCGCGPNGCS